MFVEFLQRTPPLRRFIHWTSSARAAELVRRFEPYLSPSDSILDIGAGTCHVCELLRSRGLSTTPIDVKNLSFVDGIAPTLYDGNTLPFHDYQFDVGLLITVLHHTPDPERVVREAARVCRRLVIIEDIYRNPIHKYLTFTADSVLNAEFFGHPHTNKNDAGWRALIDRLGLKVLDAKYQQSFVVFTHATYHLSREPCPNEPLREGHGNRLSQANG